MTSHYRCKPTSARKNRINATGLQGLPIKISIRPRPAPAHVPTEVPRSNQEAPSKDLLLIRATGEQTKSTQQSSACP
eukprot:1156085-Pelagomonas_calceolata.AAC.4